MTHSSTSTYSPYLPTSEIFPPKMEDFGKKMTQTYADMVQVINIRQIGTYDPVESVTGQQFATTNPQVKRQSYRKVIDFGALPNATTKTVAHGLTVNAAFSLTQLYGAATNPVSFLAIPLPYASPTLANAIELSIDATNIIVTTGSNRTGFTTTFIVLEYLKS